MARFILVPGGWHGAWAFDAVGSALSVKGHEVQALTLAGLGDQPANGVNLERHIDDALQAVRARDTPAVLVGHSYGGMVITGAADKEPSRIQAIVYADAYVPEDGASVWSLTTAMYRERFVAGAAADGLNCAPPGHLDARCRPHPMGTFLQAIRLTGNWRNVRSKVFIAACGWEGTPFVDLYERLRSDPEWSTHGLDCAHDIPRLAPEALANILLKCA
ncbi:MULTISPECIES: alpha/beta fold hydrolase [Variovorax]|jgi:pimeloyl-ACP methyl ester carboxylesterase|uniref:alpha/beta fold hydrolase n=1 Tax=Variovorax TaxID=34072 RepID=UPI00285C7D0C|nr:alpha/beta fold hydrolase [Variovorax sp. 3319]MDR6890004.1 pimeloyl-ACP methyl ester carboxylesterase [Variovorax sp. 3319]